MEKHDLRHEFPEFETKIHELKVSDSHFKKMFEDYHQINNEIHRIETGAEITTDETLNRLRMNRVELKDHLYAMIIK